MELQKLINALREQSKNLKNFSATARKKQKAIIASDLENLQKAIVEEEKVIFNIQSAERMRLDLVAKLKTKHALPEEIFKLKELAELLNGKENSEDISELLVLEKEVKTSIKEVNDLNEQNRLLVDHCRSLIKETLNALLGERQKSALLDKRY